MKNRRPLTPFAPRTVRRFVLPLTLASILFMAGIILDGVLDEPGPNVITIIYGTAWLVITLLYDFLIAKSTIFHGPFSWFYSITSIIGLGVLMYILPPHLGELFHIMIIFGVVVTATVFGRVQAYIVLVCSAIQQHIKQADAVGRWGGEEFIISLPGATGAQAFLVAQRIVETMASLQVTDREGKAIPVPTVSQGIAVYPSGADEIYQLIDLADRCLYVAKERGRNQVEPELSHWEKIQEKQKM